MFAHIRFPAIVGIFMVVSFSCCGIPFNEIIENSGSDGGAEANPEPTQSYILESPVDAGESNPNEPVIITGTIPFTSPFFLAGNAEPFVMLEDEAGFAARDLEFEFPLAGQTIGAVEMVDDSTLSYSLALPSVPQGTLLDVDNDGESDKGVMVFTVAYWSNTWGGPFLEKRDGTGWSSAYASTTTDPERDYEINGGYLIIWAPDDEQSFPSGFGDDDMLLTEDDPVQLVPPGYSIVDLNQEPFEVYKEAHPEFDLVEGGGAINDFSDMDYADAFEAMFAKVSVEYPFTDMKGVDWQALYDEFSPRAEQVHNDDDFYRLLHDFSFRIPDGHVGVTFNGNVFREEQGGGLGLSLAELTDGEIVVSQVFPATAADDAGIEAGAQIIEWNGQPVEDALDDAVAYMGPYSTEHARRLDQLVFITRMPVGDEVTVLYENPGEDAREITMTADIEYESFFASIPYLNEDELALPVEGYVMDDTGLAYIRINSFSDDNNLQARIWERYIDDLIENDIEGLIIDVRVNGGGSMSLAIEMAAYFFDEEIEINRNAYYNANSGEFEFNNYPSTLEPAPLLYDAPIAVLVSPDCVSACEGFANAMTLNNRAIIVGQYPSAGAFGEVGQGQYSLPGDLDMQFPTGRPVTFDGDILIEGAGVVPDVLVPVTLDSALGKTDAVLDAAVEALFDEIR